MSNSKYTSYTCLWLAFPHSADVILFWDIFEETFGFDQLNH